LLEDQTFEPAPINRRQFVKLSTVAGLTGLALGIAPNVSQAAAGNADGSVSEVTSPNMLWWRSVGNTHTAFVIETLVDELAEATGKYPVTFRRELLSDHPRHLAALDLVIGKSGYGDKQLPSDQAWGIAIHESFNSVVAYVVEVSLTDGHPRVHQVTGAIHCNMAVNPSAVVAQVQGAASMGLGMIIDGAEITLVDGRVQQRNFDSYRGPRLSDVPSMDVYIVASTDPPTGVGEPGLPPIAPAVANAIRRLTGQSQRQLPFVLT
jgi:isoquinoline 1-oxidoreductase subunit beta